MRPASFFLSPLTLVPLIGPFLSDLSFSPSPFFSLLRKWPWRVGRLWAEASQSRWRNEGDDSSHAGFPDCVCVCELVCVCVHVPAGGCQRMLVWHGSRFQRLPRKWSGNNPAKTVLKSDRESDFGELISTLGEGRVGQSWGKKRKFCLLLFIQEMSYYFMSFLEYEEVTPSSVGNL